MGIILCLLRRRRDQREMEISVKPDDIYQVIFLSCKNEGKTIVFNLETIDAISNSLEDILKQSEPIAENDIAVKVVVPSPSGGINEFLSALKSSMKRYNMSLVECSVQHLNEDENDEKRFVVVCNNHSRLHDDIKNTFASIQPARYCQIILLVVHMKLPKDLPATTSRVMLKYTEECKQLCYILDIAFHKNYGVNGIYECEMNKRLFDIIRGIMEKNPVF